MSIDRGRQPHPDPNLSKAQDAIQANLVSRAPARGSESDTARVVFRTHGSGPAKCRGRCSKLASWATTRSMLRSTSKPTSTEYGNSHKTQLSIRAGISDSAASHPSPNYRPGATASSTSAARSSTRSRERAPPWESDNDQTEHTTARYSTTWALTSIWLSTWTCRSNGTVHFACALMPSASTRDPSRFDSPCSPAAEPTCESFDDAKNVYRIRLEVRNDVFGFLFGYEGEFTCDFVPASDAPDRLKPRRHERRG